MADPITRRGFVGGAGAILMGASARGSAAIRQSAKARIIVDNDFAGDPDGLIALAQQLLTRAAVCTLVTTSPLDPKLAALGGLPAGATAKAGQVAALDLIGRMGLAKPPAIIAGSERFSPDAASPAAEAIIAEAMRDDPLPLYLTCGGPLTNLAQALRAQPAIARRMTLIWIGGAAFPGGGTEYNLSTDLDAARTVIERSMIPVWQVPEPAYRQFQLSVAELTAVIRTISPLGAWLHDRYSALPPFVSLGGSITLGDSPLVLLGSISADSSEAREQPARRILDDGHYGADIPDRTLRVFERLDARLALADFVALLREQAG